MNLLTAAKIITLFVIIGELIYFLVNLNRPQPQTTIKPIENSTHTTKPSPSLQQTLHLTTIGYINNPTICNKSNTLDLISVVISSPENADRRLDLRNTWTKPLTNSSRACVVFFMGRTENSSVDERALEEGNATGDLVIVDFVESYRNLSLKTLLMLRWVRDFCPNAKFVLKVDDDVFINVFMLLGLVGTGGLSDGVIYGRLTHGWVPIRENDSKWTVTEEEFAGETYPDYVTGPSYLVGAKFIGKLVETCFRVPYLFLEDVFVTGVCAETCNISRKHLEGFVNVEVPDNRCGLLNVISGHRIYGSEMHAVWKLVSESVLQKACKHKLGDYEQPNFLPPMLA